MPLHKLSSADRKKIRILREHGVTHKEIAKQFGVTPLTINRALNGRRVH